MTGDLPRAHGSDRVRRDGEAMLLDCLHPKGWVERQPAPRGPRHHPGTAVNWDGTLWEVVSWEPLPPAGIRYRLERWTDGIVAGSHDAYDERSEAARAAERRAHLRREAARRSWIAASLLTGHLPARVQLHMANENGAPRTGPTIVSAAPLWIFGTVTMVFFIPAMLGAPLPFPRSLLLPGLYWFIESTVRIGYAFMTGNPIGSLPGAVAWLAWRAARERG